MEAAFRLVRPGAQLKGEPALRSDLGVSAHTTACRWGVEGGVLERRHRRSRIALLTRGRMQYQGAHRSVLLTRGAMLMGDAGDAYRKAHDDEDGDACIVVEFDDRFLDEARAAFQPSEGSLSVRDFVPASSLALNGLGRLEAAVRHRDADLLVESAHRLIASIFRLEPVAMPERGPTPKQERRVLDVLKYIDAAFADDCSLSRLAEVAGVSRFHLVRLCQRMTGQTPLQIVLGTRLRAAAAELVTTRDPVTQVALGSGFTDISHFNACFGRCFDMTPSRYRATMS